MKLISFIILLVALICSSDAAPQNFYRSPGTFYSPFYQNSIENGFGWPVWPHYGYNKAYKGPEFIQPSVNRNVPYIERGYQGLIVNSYDSNNNHR